MKLELYEPRIIPTFDTMQPNHRSQNRTNPLRAPGNRLLSLACAGSLWLGATTGFAREFRVAQLPNGTVFRCANCHVSAAGGGTRNPFGKAVEAITGSANKLFWSATLAALDSDGDGAANGVELGDPDGDRTVIAGWKVTNPGSAASKPVNAAPAVTINTPANNASFTAPAVSAVAADATDTDGTVAMVEFFDNGVSLGTATASPFSLLVDWSVGSHSVTAKATDNAGASTTSSAVNMTVLAPGPVVLTPPGLNAGDVLVSWTGGGGPFLVETKTDLLQPWGNNVQGVTGRTVTLPAVGAATFVRVADTAVIGPVAMTAALAGANERPNPVNTTATGAGTFTLNNNTLTFSITYTVLSSTAVAAHVHGPADADQSAPPMIDLATFNGGSFGTSGTLAGTVLLDADQKAALLSGQTYVNIHTGNFGGGEIRGQIVK